MSRRKQANPAKLEMERGQGENPEHIVPSKNDSGPSSAAPDNQSTTDEEVQLSAAMSQLNLISLHRVMGQTSICDFSGTSAGDPSTVMAAKAATAKAAAAIGAAKTAGRSLTSAADTATSSHGHGQSTSSARHAPKVRCATAPPIRSSTPMFGEPEVAEDLSPTSSTILLSAASSSTDPFAISVVPSAVTITDILTETEEEYEQEIQKEPAHSSVNWHYGPKTSTPKKIIDLTRSSNIPPAEIIDIGSKANTGAFATKEVASETAEISIKPTRDIASETVFETKNIATETVNVLEAASQTFVKDCQGRRALYISASQLKLVASTAFETVEGIVRTAKSDVLSLSEGESVDLSPGTTDRSQESLPATPQEENSAEPVVKKTEELYKNVQFEEDAPQPEADE